MRPLVAAFALCFSLVVSAASGPYEEGVDANAQVSAALAEATSAQMPLLVVFGANWCGDCRVLDLAFNVVNGLAHRG